MEEMFYFGFKTQGFFFGFNSHDTIPKVINVNVEYVGAYDFFSRRVMLFSRRLGKSKINIYESN
jgi:hypothetical protein